MVKIRDGENKSWVHLKRPFASFLERAGRNEEVIRIKNLSVGEDDDFNIGHIGLKNYFELAVDIIPNNQITQIHAVNERTYYLEIISDNTTPFPFKLQIRNEGYEKFNVSNIRQV